MDFQVVLERLGLGENEGKIYLSLIKSGPVTVSSIAKQTGLHRPTIYKHLPELQRVGLVTKSKRGKLFYYVAESPNKLQSLVEETSEKLQVALPEFMQFFDGQKHKPVLKVYEGKQGMRQVMTDIMTTLKRGDVFYRYSSRKEPTDDSYMPKNYRKMRDAKQIERFVIASEAYAGKKKKRLERQIKTIPASKSPFNQNVSMIMYASKVAVLDFTQDIAYVIENERFADFQKTLFKLLYSSL